MLRDFSRLGEILVLRGPLANFVADECTCALQMAGDTWLSFAELVRRKRLRAQAAPAFMRDESGINRWFVDKDQ
jgi:hypothetical protein